MKRHRNELRDAFIGGEEGCREGWAETREEEEDRWEGARESGSWSGRRAE